MPARAETDLAVVGAGVAGLAAAKTARAAGLSVRVLEAAGRIGGRACTDRDAAGRPWDRGCHWLHRARENPFRAHADAVGAAYRQGASPRHVWLGRRWAEAGETDELTRVSEAAGSAIEAAGMRGVDVPGRWVMRGGGAWLPLVRQWLAAVSGAEPEAASTLDFARYVDSPDNWPVRDGFGALVAAWGADAPVALGTPVGTIDRRGPGVALETPAGTLTARHAIVTVSTSALAAGAVRFRPEPPAWLAEALTGVPLGGAEKVMLSFDRDVFGVGHGFATSLAHAPWGFEIQIAPFDRPMAIAHAGGGFATAMAREGREAMRDRAVACLRAMFGSAVERHLADWAVTDWDADPRVRGGYSVARPGRAHLRERLSVPVDDRLRLAGEACSRDAYGTVNGAYASGVAAAEAVLAAMGERSAGRG